MTDNKLYYGTVIWFDSKKGFGFAEWENDGVKQKDIFCYFSDIVVEGFKTLYKDQKISFNLGVNNKGAPKAINIMILKN